MSFLSPGFAWLFLCLPVIVILYLLRPRHNDHPVPSTLLWQRALAQEQAQRPLQKLRRHLLLPLQLLTSAVLILCLMHPVMNSGKSTDMIFVFDLSASMQTREDGGSRLDLARAHALQLLDRMDPGSEVTVITQSLSTLCPLSRSTDRVLARRILDGLRAQDGPADLDAALSLARSLKAETEAGICVFTDKDTLSDPDLHLECLGTPQNNTAMTAFDVRDGLAFVALRAYGAGGVRTVRLTGDGTVLDVRTLEVPDNGQASLSLACPACSVYTAEILESDALAPDNIRHSIPGTDMHYTAVMNFDSLFLSSLLTLRSDVTVLRSDSGAEADLYISGPRPLVLSTSPETAVNAGEEISWQGRFPAPGSDPVFRACRFQDVSLRCYVPLLSGTPLMSLGEDALITRLPDGFALGFDLQDTNLALRYDFPLLMSGMLEELIPSTSLQTGTGECGTAVTFALPASAEQLLLQSPDGTQQTVPASRFTDTRLSGIYTLSWQDRAESHTARFALSVPESESDTTLTASGHSGDSPAEHSGRRDLRLILLGVLLLLLFLEWGVYCRGA